MQNSLQKIVSTFYELLRRQVDKMISQFKMSFTDITLFCFNFSQSIYVFFFIDCQFSGSTCLHQDFYCCNKRVCSKATMVGMGLFYFKTFKSYFITEESQGKDLRQDCRGRNSSRNYEGTLFCLSYQEYHLSRDGAIHNDRTSHIN